MYWSKYNILSKSEKYGYLLFNTMSLAFIRINEQDIDMWKKLRETPDSYTNFQNYDFLIKARILVDNQEDDLNVYLADVLKNRYNSSDMALTILPTRGCNFGCIYCYEQDRPNVLMNEQTEKAIVKFVCSNSNLKRLSVVWYGGEPLLNFDSMVRLTKMFKQLNIEYSAKIVSNGYLLTKEKADLMKDLAIRNIQITFDGSEEIHNQRRFLLGGQPTYRKIMDNLKYLLSINKEITIDIRTNIDRRNKDDYNKFYQDFKSEINDKRVTMYPGFVSDLLSSECVSPEFNISEGGYKAQFILDIFDKYGIEIKSFLPKYRRHSCVASKYFAFVIGPEGELYKCWRMVGNQKEAIGNVNDGSFDMVKFSKYLIGADYTLDSKCLQCEFITLCGGGCPLVRMRNKYEKISLNHCCPEKTHMEQLMELRYEMFVKSHQKQ
ncbi:radical SAM protein [Prevotella copri]|uniref:radical SAM/SPASM domain-containing protein n=1 Tax=Segatella copri TaxID=165179 RepID=UPI00033DEBF5|nr:radical SAM protein [Segatella copri]MBV3413544.1 radical SAM protein [Segatella copri]CDC25726.1 radical SAM domain protein [Prevotella sp. CAG:386]